MTYVPNLRPLMRFTHKIQKELHWNWTFGWDRFPTKFDLVPFLSYTSGLLKFDEAMISNYARVIINKVFFVFKNFKYGSWTINASKQVSGPDPSDYVMQEGFTIHESQESVRAKWPSGAIVQDNPPPQSPLVLRYYFTTQDVAPITDYALSDNVRTKHIRPGTRIKGNIYFKPKYSVSNDKTFWSGNPLQQAKLCGANSANYNKKLYVFLDGILGLPKAQEQEYCVERILSCTVSMYVSYTFSSRMPVVK